MRKQKDRFVAADSAEDKDTFTAASIKLHRQKDIYEYFCKAAGTYTEYERTLMQGYDRHLVCGPGAVIRKHNALKNAQVTLTNSENGGIIKAGSERMTISSIDSPIEQRHTGKGSPNAILHFDVELNNRQQELLNALPDYDSRVIVLKASVNMVDLSALTAKTGDEFSMFTKGNHRLIIRGNYKSVNIDAEEAQKLAAQGFKWSGHTHPGADFFCMEASDGDWKIFQCFSQKSMVIYNSKGQYRKFEKE